MKIPNETEVNLVIGFGPEGLAAATGWLESLGQVGKIPIVHGRFEGVALCLDAFPASAKGAVLISRQPLTAQELARITRVLRCQGVELLRSFNWS